MDGSLLADLALDQLRVDVVRDRATRSMPRELSYAVTQEGISVNFGNMAHTKLIYDLVVSSFFSGTWR